MELLSLAPSKSNLLSVPLLKSHVQWCTGRNGYFLKKCTSDVASSQMSSAIFFTKFCNLASGVLSARGQGYYWGYYSLDWAVPYSCNRNNGKRLHCTGGKALTKRWKSLQYFLKANKAFWGMLGKLAKASILYVLRLSKEENNFLNLIMASPLGGMDLE